MAYLFSTPEEQQAMRAAIGAQSINELFATIPEAMRLRRPLNLPDALGEMPLTRSLTRLASENQSTQQLVCFLGAGAYDHFIPAVVDAIASRSEFYTSYTPYQPEVSQGNLRVMFEYQTLVCQLTGLDVANASLYDGASAAAEAVLLCMSATEWPKRVVTAASVHPEYRAVIRTYFANLGAELVEVATPEGRVSPSDLARAVDRNTACVLWKTAYARSRLANSQRYEVCFQLPTFKEFLVRDKRGDVASALAAARREGILAGVPLGRWYPELADCFLVAVTEQRTREEIDRWSEALERA